MIAKQPRARRWANEKLFTTLTFFFLIIFAQPSSGIKVIQRQAAASVTDPLLCDSLAKKKKERKRNAVCKLLGDKRGHCF